MVGNKIIMSDAFKATESTNLCITRRSQSERTHIKFISTLTLLEARTTQNVNDFNRGVFPS